MFIVRDWFSLKGFFAYLPKIACGEPAYVRKCLCSKGTLHPAMLGHWLEDSKLGTL